MALLDSVNSRNLVVTNTVLFLNVNYAFRVFLHLVGSLVFFMMKTQR